MPKNDDDWLLGILLLALFWFFKNILGGIPPIVIPRKDKKDEEPTNRNGKPRPEEEPLPEPVTPIEEPTNEPIETIPPFITLPDIREFPFVDIAPEPEPLIAEPFITPEPGIQAPGVPSPPGMTEKFGLMAIETTPEMELAANILTGAALITTPITVGITSLANLFGSILKSPKVISPFITPVAATPVSAEMPTISQPLIVGEPTTPQQKEFEEYFKAATLPLIRGF